MQPRIFNCNFEAIQTQEGQFLSKILPGGDASIEKSALYMSKSKYSIRAKDIQKLEFLNEDRSIRIAASKGRVFELQYAISDDKAWQQFCRRLQTMHEKHGSSESSKGFSSFLEKSSKVGLGKHYHRKNTMVMNSSSTNTSKPRRQRGTFGKQLNTTAAATSRKILHPPMPWDDDQEIVSDETSDMDFHHMTSSRPAIEEQSFSPIKSSIEAQNEQLEKEDLSPVVKKSSSKRKRSVLDDEEDSDDDILFTSGAKFTTPAAQNVVSPGGTTTTKKSTMTSPERPIAPSPEKGQQKLLTFFPKQKRDGVHKTTTVTSSFDPATRYAASHQASATRADAKTPDRLPMTPSKSPSRLILSSNVKRQQLEQSDSWLQKSPSRVASAERRQRERLFGKEQQALTPRKEDPIEEFEDDSDKKLLEPPPLIKQDVLVTSMRRFSRPRLDHRRSAAPFRSHNRFSTPLYENKFAVPSAQDDSFEIDPRRNRFRGLKNLGNTCYASASLQMICTMGDTVRALKSRGGELTSSVVAVAEQLQDSSTTTTPVDPVAVKDAMDAKTNKFHGYEQRDAHEFISDLVDYIHEEVEEKGGNSDSTSDEKMVSPMDDFLLTVEVCLTCQSCGYDRCKQETYRHISVDIIKEDDGDEVGLSRASVEKGLAHFFQPELREIKCEKCNEGTHAMQTLHVLNRPKALLLHLKRFIFVEKPIEQTNTENESPNSPSSKNKFVPVEYVFRKNKASVCLSEELTLAPFETPNKKEDSTSATLDAQYHLKSVVHHIGARASSGHYTADVVRRLEPNIAKAIDPEAKEAVEGWVSFDDGSSYVTTLEKILASKNKQTTAYMLLYCLGDHSLAQSN